MGKSRSLFIQLSVTITVFIAAIEFVLLVGSRAAKEREFTSLNGHLEKEIYQKYGVEVKEAFSKEFVEERLQQFTINIILLVALIIVVTVAGTLFVFHHIAGKHLMGLIRFNKRVVQGEQHVQYPAKEIPGNEIGELISTQNDLLRELEDRKFEAIKNAKALRDKSTFSALNPGPVFRVNRFGNIVDANKMTNLVFHTESVIGHPLSEICPDIKLEAIERLATRGGMLNKEVNVFERAFLIQLIGIPEFQSINVYGVDVSEMKDLQAQLFHSAKLASIGELAAGVAHEINNPLTILKGYIDILAAHIKKQPMVNEEVNTGINALNSSVERITTIVKGLRTYSRLDGEAEASFEINDVVKNEVVFLENIYKKEDVSIELSITNENTVVHGNAGKIQQVLTNLLSNAKDAMESVRDKRIRVSTKIEEGNVVFEVTDNGCGIDGKVKEKIFHSFYTTKQMGKGTGLGLGIVRSIVQKMNGKIEVTSKLGEGATFKVSLPRFQGKSTLERSGEDIVSISRLKGRVLVVDDDSAMRSLVVGYVKEFGLEVDDADCAQSALNLLKDGQYDYVISDLQMPRMSGVELFSQCQQIGFRGKFVLTSGANLGADSEAYTVPGGVLPKPFSKTQLYMALIGTQTNRKAA